MRASFLLAAVILGCSGSASPEAEVNDAESDSVTSGEETSTVDDSGTVADSATDTTMTPPMPTDGCGKAATAGSSNKTIAVGAAMRTYVLVIPAGYDPMKPTMLAFGWHGRTGNGALFRLYSGVEKASGGKAIFVYPDGLPVTSDPKDTGWELTGTGRDIAFYDAMLKELTSTLCVDSKRVVSFGHSFGGYMSNAVGCFRPAVTRAIAPYAGGGPFSACGTPVTAWIAHSADDAVVNISEGRKSRDFWTKKAGCAMTSMKVSPEPCVAYDGCSVPVIYCESPTGGHNWPAYAGAGIWNFFASL
jgi:polyhydroxybutyrate depolymerase